LDGDGYSTAALQAKPERLRPAVDIVAMRELLRSEQATYGQGLRFAQGIIENVEKQFNLNETQSRAYRMFLDIWNRYKVVPHIAMRLKVGACI
jgi:hypothetical protein